MPIITSSDILATIKKDEATASTSFRFPDTDILTIIDEEIRSTVLPIILKLNSNRVLFTEYQTITASQQAYNIPYRAVASQVRDLIVVDSITTPTWKRNLVLYELENADIGYIEGEPCGVFFSSDKIMLTPTPNTTENFLKITYPIAHSKLVPTTATATISSVNYSTGVVTLLSTAPSTFTTSLSFDFIQANKKCRPAIVAIDKSSSLISGSSMTFAVADLPLGLVNGDLVALSEETSVLLIPNECYKFLCKAVELKIMEAQRDIQSIQLISESIKIAKSNMIDILTKRITGEPQPVIHPNGLLRRTTFSNVTKRLTP